MHIDRMTRLRDFCLKMEGLGASLDMNIWYDCHTVLDRNMCGRGCVIGWALAQKVFTSDGLSSDPHIWRPRFGTHTGREALERFFVLATDDVTRLFFPVYSPVREPSWRDKIESIDALIADERGRRTDAQVRELGALAEEAAKAAASECLPRELQPSLI